MTGPATPTITCAAKTPATICQVNRNGGKPPDFTAAPNKTAPVVPTQKHSKHLLSDCASSIVINCHPEQGDWLAKDCAERL